MGFSPIITRFVIPSLEMIGQAPVEICLCIIILDFYGLVKILYGSQIINNTPFRSASVVICNSVIRC